MSDKFIPRADHDFKMMTMWFTKHIVENPERFQVAKDDVDALTAAVEEYNAAATAHQNPSTRNRMTTENKINARRKAEEIIRRIAQMIRANHRVDAQAKFALNIKERAARSKKKSFQVTSPNLEFVKALHGAQGATPMHELKFYTRTEHTNYKTTKPDGATRLELFVDLIPPDAAIPNNPGATPSGRPWYLRSYTKSPILLEPPMARVPMRVVYWARWADSTGNVGPFSATVVGWIEGGNVSRPAQYPGSIGKKETPMISVDAPKQLMDETAYSVAVIEAHYLTVNRSAMREENPSNPKLEVTVIKESKQLEGPVESEAA